MNFCEFIAGYRIEYAKQALDSEPDKSVLEIAMATGFNTQSTFNNTFKKITGLTPTGYKKQMKVNALKINRILSVLTSKVGRI